MFTQNQVRQFYVANAYQAASGLANAGDIALVDNNQGDIYFNYMNPDGEVLRTDLIPKDKIMSITVTPAEKMKYTSKAVFVKLDSNALDENSKPIAGEDYMLKILLSRNNWPSEQTPNWKHGIVHVVAGTANTASNFYKKMAISLAQNLDREGLLKVYITTAATADAVVDSNIFEVTAMTKETDLTGSTYAGIVIDEVAQPWRLGIKEQLPVRYKVYSDTIYVSGDEVKWGEETEIPGFTTVENGKDIADLEWFHHGQRGDIYREAAYPTNWPNQMVADPTQKYDTVDIHYYWNGANHAIQKSEKDITIACVVPASGAAAVTEVVSALNSALGLSGDGALTYSATGDTSTVILG